MRKFELIAAMALFATAASAQMPGGSNGPHGHPSPSGRPPMPSAMGSVGRPMPSAMRERMEQRREEMSDRMREHMDHMRERAKEMRERRDRADALRTQIKTKIHGGNANPEELKKDFAELRSLQGERRRQHRMMLFRRWGPSLNKPDVSDELTHHAQRLARLQRMEELIATERKPDQQKGLLARIEHLRDLENKRHERAMQRLAPDAGTPPSASATPTAPAPDTSGGLR